MTTRISSYRALSTRLVIVPVNTSLFTVFSIVMLTITHQCLANGVLISRHKPIRDMAPIAGAELAPPALKICMTIGLTKKEIEKTGTTIRHAITKVMRARK